jgi:hypothetical protein
MFHCARQTKAESASESMEAASKLRNQIDSHIDNLESQPELDLQLFRQYHPYFKRWSENGESKATLHFGKKSHDLSPLELHWLQNTIANMQKVDDISP